MLKKLCLVLALAAGCAAPQNKFGGLEYLRDSRDYSTVSIYGGAEFSQTKFFGNVDLNSPFNRSDTTDLTRFNGRARVIRPLYNGFGVTAEAKTASGDNNDVGGIGASYSPVKGAEIRAYPFRTDGESKETGISINRTFECGDLDPYVGGFADLRMLGGQKRGLAELQVGVRKNGWRFGVEFRYSDFDRKNGFEGKGAAVLLGLDF